MVIGGVYVEMIVGIVNICGIDVFVKFFVNLVLWVLVIEMVEIVDDVLVVGEF